MSDIKINNHIGRLQDYFRQTETNQRSSPSKEIDNTLFLGELKQSLEQVQDVYESNPYQIKTDSITKQVRENRYEINIDQLINQLVAEDIFTESV